MNIFVLDQDPREAAILQCDRHVVKMSLETAQILSTVAHELGYSPAYKRTHVNHPCVRWAAAASGNFQWLLQHAFALCDEYTHRYGRVHASRRVVQWISENVPCVPGPLTPFAQAMPDIYRCDNAVLAYRRYYIGEKAAIAAWTRRQVPDWFKKAIEANERPSNSAV